MGSHQGDPARALRSVDGTPRHDRPPPPPRAATLPLVVAGLVVPTAVAWILVGPYVGILATGLAAVLLVVFAVTR